MGETQYIWEWKRNGQRKKGKDAMVPRVNLQLRLYKQESIQEVKTMPGTNIYSTETSLQNYMSLVSDSKSKSGSQCDEI